MNFRKYLDRLINGIRDFEKSEDSHEQLERAQELFEDRQVRDWVFGPFRALFEEEVSTEEAQVRKTITGVALANAVIAGIPGKLGIGVGIAVAFEIYMAVKIARHVGINSIKTPRDVLNIMMSLSGAGLMIFIVFKEILGICFSFFNLVGALPATVLAELAATDFLGILLWIGFCELKTDRPFRIPKRLMARAARETKELVQHQWRVLKKRLSPSNLLLVGKRLKAWFSGEVVFAPMQVSDNAFNALAMAAVLSGDKASLEGPMGQMFLKSIRELYPDLRTASIPEIADHFAAYNEEQMTGVTSQIKGTLHEHMVSAAENSDGDAWISKMFDSPYHPSTDLLYTNTDTGETFELSLKATDSSSYIEQALARYPHDPIAVTNEVSEKFSDDPRVSASGVSLEHLNEVTKENFDELLQQQPSMELRVVEGVLVGSAITATIALWPYFAAWKRDRISEEQFRKAGIRILGSSAGRALPRVCAGIILGATFGWYRLAMGVYKLAIYAQENS
jgi:hypothetical protein